MNYQHLYEVQEKVNILKKESVIKNAEKIFDGKHIIIKVSSDNTFPELSLPERYEWGEYDDNTPIKEEVDEPFTQKPRTLLTIRTRTIKRPASQSAQGLKIFTK